MADGSRAVMMAYDTMNNPSPSEHGLDRVVWSHDDGLTWGGAATMGFNGNEGGLLGPAVGLQAKDGTLYVAGRLTPGADVASLLISKDLGKSWAVSKHGISGVNECAIAWKSDAADGEMIMNCRTGEHARAQAFWSADGTPLGNATYPKGLVDANCQGSIINAGGKALYTSNAADADARARMTIKRSADEGATWSDGVLVHKGPSAYSQLVSLGDRIGCLFEAGKKSAYETISFVAIDA